MPLAERRRRRGGSAFCPAALPFGLNCVRFLPAPVLWIRDERREQVLCREIRSNTVKYDDAENCFLNFDTDRLPNEAGGTHTGMYLAWAATKGLLSDAFDESTLAPLKARQITGSQLYFSQCDGKLTDDDFNDVGNAFTASYYESSFFADYERVFGAQMPNGRETTEDFCSVPDTWANHDRLAALLNQRFAQWQEGQSPTPSPAAPPLALVDDPTQVVEGIRRRAEAGEQEAWFDLGVEFITGQRVAQDMAAAADAFTRGAGLGSVECQFNLGVCFQNGDGRPKDAAKALHWFGQAASGGHGEGLFQLAIAYRHGVGAPADPVAANALMLLAQSRGSANARKAGITAGTLSESTALLDQIRQPGQLLLVLARRRQGAAAAGAGRTRASPTRSTRRASASADHSKPSRVGGAAVIALLVGAASFILLLLATSFIKGTALQVLAVALGAISAFGAYRCSLGLGKSGAMAALLAGLAFVPVLGSFVCLGLVLQIVRQRDAG
jgi:hypothetical protein